MLSLRRIFGLMLLFFFFEAVVAVVTTFAYPDVSVFLACAAMTGLALGVWAVFVLVTRIMMRPHAPAAAPQPRAAMPPVAKTAFGDDSFTLEIGGYIREANRRLIGAVSLNARREQPTVATLPLFLVIGAEGVGKTSLLVNSGLEPRLLAGEATREGTVLPTRLCNLWFAEDSIFADVSGRVLMHESENWERTLRVLGQQPRMPKWKRILFGQRSQPNLKGLVLVCDTNTFLNANDPQRAGAIARTLNERLQTVGTVFRKDFPVYVVFTKCDGVQFFPEFFSHLSDMEGRRILGATLPFVKTRNDAADAYADREGKRLTNFFNRLYMSLADKRMLLLAREDEAKKKSIAYEFPRELKKLRGDVVQYLLDVFRPNPLQQGPRLRGFYFSGQRMVARANASAAEGTVAEFSIAPKRADATVFFGSKPQVPAAVGARIPSAGIAKWMFITEIFNTVVLKDRTGYVAPRVNTRDQVYRNLAFGGVGAVLLLLSLIWANSWRNNRRLLTDTLASVEATQRVASSSPTPEALSGLESLRASLAHLEWYDRHGAPLSYRWGLYSGSSATTALHRLYFDRFRQMFMNPIVQAFDARFLSLQSTAPVQDDIYTMVKTYRMITSGECPLDEGVLNSTLMPVWSAAVPDSPDSSELAEKQMQFYVSELKNGNPYKQQITEDNKAVIQAQDYLRDLNGPDRMFRALVEQVNHDKPGESLTRYAANYTEVMTGPNTIEAAYTRDGWDTMMESIRSHKVTTAGDTCVLGKTSKFSNLTLDAATENSVEELYIQSYIKHWKQFLAAHHVMSFNNTADAARKLGILADNNRSPLLGLVYMTSHSTDVASAPSVNSMVVNAVEKTKQGIGNIIDKWRKKPATPQNQPTAPAVVNAAEIVYEFEPAREVADPATPDKWLNSKNQEYIKALDGLGLALAAIPPRPDPKVPADQQAIDAARKAEDNANTALHTLTASFPNRQSDVDVALKALLTEPITYTDRVLAHLPKPPVVVPPPPPPTPEQLAKPIKEKVNQQAESLCASVEALRAKYPFNPTASQETTTQDLNEVLAPATSSLAQFSQSKEVSQVYLRQGRAWTPNPSFPGTFSQPFLQALNNLSDFAGGLYADGGATPHFDYTVSLDGTGKVPFELDVDGHVVKFVPGKPSIPAKLVWPPITYAPTKLVVKLFLKNGAELPAQNSGPWSLFHLLQNADDQNGNLFTFRTIQFAGSGHIPLQDPKGNPVTIQVRVDTGAVNMFGKGYFSKMRCEGWAVH